MSQAALLSDLGILKNLGEGRWVVPIMAMVSAGRGARFAVMAKQLKLSRHSLTRTLTQLREFGWVAPNSGHGHPLRPEYVLTDIGEAVGRVCERIMAARAALGLGPADLSRWSLPVIAGLAGGKKRFGEIEAALDPITPRALVLALEQLCGVGLVEREGPAPYYALTIRGKELAEAV